MNTNQKGFINIVLIVLIVMLAGTVGYLAFNQKSSVPSPAPSPTPGSTSTPISTPTSSPTPAPGPKNDTVSVSLGQQFTLKKNRVAKIADTGLEVEIAAFYNSPCPAGVQCFWSGIGIGFEYHFNGQVQRGVDLVQAFGYQTTVVKTDFKTYADLVVEKMK